MPDTVADTLKTGAAISHAAVACGCGNVTLADAENVGAGIVRLTVAPPVVADADTENNGAGSVIDAVISGCGRLADALTLNVGAGIVVAMSAVGCGNVTDADAEKTGDGIVTATSAVNPGIVALALTANKGALIV